MHTKPQTHSRARPALTKHRSGITAPTQVLHVQTDAKRALVGHQDKLRCRSYRAFLETGTQLWGDSSQDKRSLLSAHVLGKYILLVAKDSGNQSNVH